MYSWYTSDTMSDSPQGQQNPGILANILAVAGFIILIIVIVWGAYHLLRLTGSGVTSLFSRFGGADSITITVPKETQSGTAFPLSWEYKTEEAGAYSFLYQCKTGFRFDMSTNNRATAIPCGSAYTVGTSTSISLVPVLAGTTTMDVPVSIVFIPSATSTENTSRPQGAATVRVLAKAGATSTPVATTPSTPTTPTTPRPPGKPDLSVRIVAVGVINPVTGAFENRYPVGPEEIAAVQFDIANNGSASTGNYYFSVNLPMQGGYLYQSPIQANLTPGSHVLNTLRFKPLMAGGGTVTVSVDTTYAIGESNEGNNAAALYVNGPTWTGYYAPYVY
jgi:hypothetical protein